MPENTPTKLHTPPSRFSGHGGREDKIMGIQGRWQGQVAAARRKVFDSSDQLSLGELILKLEAITDRNLLVCFDFCNASPTSLMSWRGIYAELCLGFTMDPTQITIGQLLVKLKGAIGATYMGYKGGDYVMERTTPMWVANYGGSGSTAIVNVLTDGYQAILETRYREA